MTLLMENDDSTGQWPDSLGGAASAGANRAEEPRTADRGWLLFSGGLYPGPSNPVPEWVLQWPCDLRVLTDVVARIRGGEESQQELLRIHAETHGSCHAPSTFDPVQMSFWLIHERSAIELGWNAPHPGACDPEADRQQSADALELLFNATLREVPPTTYVLNGDNALVARRVSAGLAKLERAGKTHGEVLLHNARDHDTVPERGPCASLSQGQATR